MLGYWNEFDRTFAAMDLLRRRVEQALGEHQEEGLDTERSWPRVSVWDAGEKLVLKADVPGMTEKELQVQLTNDVLTLSGERLIVAPEGYSVHRQERVPVKFSRSFTLPVKVNPDTIAASLKDGILSVELPKAPESRPRQIAVKVG
jgi:HSP20 family protein